MKGSRVETVEISRKEYKELLEKVGKKLQYLKVSLAILATSRKIFKFFE